jgi:hypothetical protein
VRAPTAWELLAVWERCSQDTPAERALALLALAGTEAPRGVLGDLTVGERDLHLLDLHALLFGPELSGASTCPRCGETVELSMRAHELRVPSPDTREEITLVFEGRELRFRLPTAADLAAVSHEPTPDSACARLLERCLQAGSGDGNEPSVGALPDELTETLSSRMADADPQADVELEIECPSCGNTSRTAFDVATFLWSELDSWARRTVYDVHTLASAYGWSESEILALGPRRELYLELAQS